MPRANNGEARKMTAAKFPSDIQVDLDACHKAASERAGVQSLPLSTVLTEIVRLGLPLYKERIGLTTKPSNPTKGA
jgi:hypothetical protein